MKIIYLVTIAFLFSEASLLAQKSRSVDVSLFAFQYAKGHQQVFLHNKAGEYDAVSLSSANVVGPFKVALSENGEVFLHEHQKTAEGEDVYPVIAGVNIPRAVKEPLLVLVPRSGDQVYGLLVVDCSASKFPEGAYQLINFSKNDIRALIGKTRLIAPPLEITSFDPSSSSDDMLNVHFQYKLEDKWKTFGRTRWVNEKEKRSLLLAYLDPRTERMRIKAIPIQRITVRKRKE
jgi:hypothetical protein